MANIIGDWKLIALLTYDEENHIMWGDRAHFEAEDDDSSVKLFDIICRFCEDGRVLHLMSLPEGITEEFVKEQGMEMIDGKALVEETTWKEENGACYIDSGETREVCGEVLSSFDEIKFDGNTIVLPSMKFERI